MTRRFSFPEKETPISQQSTSVLNSVAMMDVVVEYSCVKSRKRGSGAESVVGQKWKRREHL